MEKNKRKEIFGKVMDLFIDHIIKQGLVENEAEAYNMLTEYVGQKTMEE
jgi:hypothetical protein